MIRDICKDEAFLAQKAEAATPDDINIAADLLETLRHHKDGCVGMAANMIGVNKRIIAFDNEGSYMVMFNPEIIKNPTPMTQKKAVFPSPAPVRLSDGSPLRFAGRMNNFRNG